MDYTLIFVFLCESFLIGLLDNLLLAGLTIILSGAVGLWFYSFYSPNLPLLVSRHNLSGEEMLGVVVGICLQVALLMAVSAVGIMFGLGVRSDFGSKKT